MPHMKLSKMNYKRIKRDCFWDLNITEDDIKDIAAGKDRRKKQMLFEKILLNSTVLFADMQIFDKDELADLLQNYQLPRFNQEYAFRRKNMIEVYFFDKPLLIDELKWVA